MKQIFLLGKIQEVRFPSVDRGGFTRDGWNSEMETYKKEVTGREGIRTLWVGQPG